MTAAVVRGRRVVLPDGIRSAAIHVRDGRIHAVAGYDDVLRGAHLVDAQDLVILPGLVDTHVHINDPGRADWEGFACATRAAAAGGVTTLIDMPLNSVPPTTTVEGFDAKLGAASGRCHVDVGFWGGVVPGNGAALEPLAAAGVLGFKCFLAPSGVDEFAHVSEADLQPALSVLARIELPLLAHAELPGWLRDPDPHMNPRDHDTWLRCRPPASEHEAIDLLSRLAAASGAHVHVVHLASADALPMLVRARASGTPLTVETCPHYLTFAAEDIPDGATAFKCAPPIRERDHRERLWQALAAGQIDLVATDHSPAPLAMKHVEDGDFTRAWGGIASVQLGLGAVWTGARSRGVPLERVVLWMAAAPARLAGIDRSKGSIAVGRDADLVVWDPDVETPVEPGALYHRHPVTPYAGMRLKGQVRLTMLRGEVVYRDGRFAEPRGRVLLGRAARRAGARISQA
jgi:allantoinase